MCCSTLPAPCRDLKDYSCAAFFVPIVLQLKSCNAALQAAGLGSSSGGVDVRIKWPNDVYAGQLKLGGILCHSSYRDRKFHVIMGVRWAAQWPARQPV